MIKAYATCILKHHPLNPRKDYGDISELAESIKANGMLQPLTIVPAENGEECYYVVIGNRRLEAAIAAGIEAVPCDLEFGWDHERIIATMLAENIVRENLTAYDEAEGFQMMLDLGKPVKEVAEYYGFSESTVRKRVNLLSLDKEEFKKATERGATLFDMAQAEELDDPEERKKVLKAAGTKNFENALKTAKEKQEQHAYIEKLEDKLKEYAESMNHAGYKDGKCYLYPTKAEDGKEVSDGICAKTETRFSCYNKDEVEFEPVKGEKYFYVMDYYGATLYKQIDPNYVPPKTAEQIMTEERHKEAEEHTARRDTVEKICKQLRIDFFKSFKPKKDDLPELWKFLSRALDSSYSMTNDETCIKEFGFEVVEDGYKRLVNPISEDNQLKHLLAMAFCKNGGGCNISKSYWDSALKEYVVKYDLGEEIQNVYDFMIKCGYECSEEENKLLDGSHDIYDLSWADKYHLEKAE